MISAFIQGISPVLPIVFVLLLSIVSLFISWWSYIHLTVISSQKKWLLISLRGTALFILILLLINPFITDQFITSEKPKIAVYLDNSQSMSIERGDYHGLETYNELITRFENTRSEEFDYNYYFFDTQISEDTELNASGTRTNIQAVVDHIREFETVYSASLLFSDGIITQGRDPVFTAQQLNSPIITVPVGDTSQVRDIAVSDVDFSTPVYTNTRHFFNIEIQQEGFEEESTPVHFIKNGELIESKNINFDSPATNHQLQFEHNFEEEGFYEMEISVPPKPEEFTTQNNRTAFTVEAIEDKTHILSLAFEVHPDVSSIRRLIATDQQNELISTTWLGPNRFIGDSPLNIDDELDLIVLHGLPDRQSEIFSWILNQQVPVLYVAVPSSYSIKTDPDFVDLISYSISGQQNVINVQIQSFSEDSSHPVLEIGTHNVRRFPPLNTAISNYNLSTVAEPLLMAEYQGTPTDIPLLLIENVSNRRISSVNAFGWYIYEQHNNRDVQEFYKQLFTNLISWTSTAPDRRTLSIEPVRDSFTENEPVQIRASLFNERGEPEPQAFIELEINRNDADEESATFRMNHQRNETYNASLGTYPEGIYNVEAVATKNNRIIGTAETRFRVSSSAVEFLNTKRNDNLLIQLSSITEGLFIENLDFENLNRFLAEGDFGEIREEVTTDYIYIYESEWLWFIFVLILLSTEWLIRRSASLP